MRPVLDRNAVTEGDIISQEKIIAIYRSSEDVPLEQ